MRPVAVHLKLSGKFHGHHPVFHVSLLCRNPLGSDIVETPVLVIIKDADEYEVEALIEHR